MAPTLRETLRALPVLPRDGLPVLDPDAAPPTPHALFRRWLTEAIHAEVPAPHAATLATADDAGNPSARVLILKDVDDAGWWFATRRSSPKASELAATGAAAMTFFWPSLGRQVRVAGPVTAADPTVSAADFRARSDFSRAGAMTGPPTTAVASVDVVREELAAALVQVRADPDLISADWGAYVLQPRYVEMWQAADGGSVRLRYTQEGATWRRAILRP